MVLIFVVVVRTNESRVFVGVGSVVTGVYRPEYTVNGGSVIMAVVDTAVVSVVVTGLPVMVIVALTGIVALTVIVGRSGARLSN